MTTLKRAPRPAKLTVGIATNGDAEIKCDYLDQGDGVKFAQALALATANPALEYVLFVHEGTIDPAAGVVTPFVIPANVTLRAAGIGRTTFKAPTYVGADQVLFDVRAGAALEEMSIAVPAPIAGLVAPPTLPSVVIMDSGASFRKLWVTFTGGAVASQLSCAFEKFDLTTPSGIDFEDITVEVQSSGAAFAATGITAIVALTFGAYAQPAQPITVNGLTVVGDGLLDMRGMNAIPYTIAEGLIGIKCGGIATATGGGAGETMGPSFTNVLVDNRGVDPTIQMDGIRIFANGAGAYVGTRIDGFRYIADASLNAASRSLDIRALSTSPVRGLRVTGMIVDCPTAGTGSIVISGGAGVWSGIEIDAQLRGADFSISSGTFTNVCLQLQCRNLTIPSTVTTAELSNTIVTSTLTNAGTDVALDNTVSYATLVDTGVNTIFMRPANVQAFPASATLQNNKNLADVTNAASITNITFTATSLAIGQWCDVIKDNTSNWGITLTPDAGASFNGLAANAVFPLPQSWMAPPTPGAYARWRIYKKSALVYIVTGGPDESYSPMVEALMANSTMSLYDAMRGITVATGVSAWVDWRGNANNWAQATGSLQPAFRTSVAALNGQPALQPDGADDCMTIAGPVFSPNTVCTIAFVIVSLSTGTQMIFETGTGASNGSVSIYYQQQVAGVSSRIHAGYTNVGNDERTNTNPINVGAAHSVIVTYDAADVTNAVKALYVNGAIADTGVSSGATAGTLATLAWNLFRRNSTNLPLNGYMPHCWVLNKECNANEVAAIYAMHRQRFAVQ